MNKQTTVNPDLWNSLAHLDSQPLIDQLASMPKVHSFSGCGLMGCDIGGSRAIEYILEHGARLGDDRFAGFGLDHPVVTVDAYGHLICLELDLPEAEALLQLPEGFSMIESAKLHELKLAARRLVLAHECAEYTNIIDLEDIDLAISAARDGLDDETLSELKASAARDYDPACAEE